MVKPTAGLLVTAVLLVSGQLTSAPCWAQQAGSDGAFPTAPQSANGLERLRLRSAARHWDAAQARWREHRRQSQVDSGAQPQAEQQSPQSEVQFEKPIPDSAEIYAQATPDPKAVPQPPKQYEQASAGRSLSIQGIDPIPSYNPNQDNKGAPNALFPSEQTLGHDEQGNPQPFPVREFPEAIFAWEASNLTYNPLYFQDIQLERYGHTHHPLVQPFVSSGRFGIQLIGLPYQMAIDPIDKCVYSLGYYRPGECAPRKYYQIPINEDALGMEALFLTGMIAIFP